MPKSLEIRTLKKHTIISQLFIEGLIGKQIRSHRDGKALEVLINECPKLVDVFVLVDCCGHCFIPSWSVLLVKKHFKKHRRVLVSRLDDAQLVSVEDRKIEFFFLPKHALQFSLRLAQLLFARHN